VIDENKTREYYNDFSARYEARRGPNVKRGYHELLDHLESDYVRRFGEGKKVLEVGCGTGLVLQRIAEFAAEAQGIDLSPGMLERAKARGLSVREGSATALPYPEASFDVTCSFKVLAHIPDIETALSEMARVTRPGGYILAEFYNPWSFRGLLRKLGPARIVGQKHNEADVFTRFDSPSDIRKLTPAGTQLKEARGVRILTLSASLIDNSLLGPMLFQAECKLADGPLNRFGGFYIAAFQKGSSA
jgi:ubiquinone/menaquinone biosynthesis C-methylase UbiE